jgi:hypothetical protein
MDRWRRSLTVVGAVDRLGLRRRLRNIQLAVRSKSKAGWCEGYTFPPLLSSAGFYGGVCVFQSRGADTGCGDDCPHEVLIVQIIRTPVDTLAYEPATI